MTLQVTLTIVIDMLTEPVADDKNDDQSGYNINTGNIDPGRLEGEIYDTDW